MAHLLPPDARIGASVSRLERGQRTVARIRSILETRPGTVPWRPEFGVDLASLVGSALTRSQLDKVRAAVQAALERWAPDIEVLGCEVHAVTAFGAGPGGTDRTIPLAEGALVRLGTQASLRVDLSLRTDEGELNLSATIRGEDAAGGAP